MENMTTKQQLEKCRLLIAECESLLLSLQFKDRIYCDTKQQTNSTVTLDNIKELVSLREKLEKAIQQIDKPEYRYVLQARYFNNFSWADIALKMNFEERYIFKIHGKALLALNEVLKNAE